MTEVKKNNKIIIIGIVLLFLLLLFIMSTGLVNITVIDPNSFQNITINMNIT